MNKESIYKIIGYKGEYNANVKKAIRKLLKENHPDNNGDRKIFELISEVKKELEDNKVSIDFKNKDKKSLFDDIDYEYCMKMVNKLTKEKEIYDNELELKKKELSDCISKYTDIYNNSIKLEKYLMSNTRYMDELKKTKKECIVILILATIVFIISVVTKEMVFLVTFALITVFCLMTIHKAFFIMKKIADNNRNKVMKYVGVNNDLRLNKDNQREIKKEIREISRKINLIENDIRFYNNLIDNR